MALLPSNALCSFLVTPENQIKAKQRISMGLPLSQEDECQNKCSEGHLCTGANAACMSP